MKIKIGFFAILMLLSLFISHPSVSLPAILAATLHELGHISMARLCGIPLRELKLGIFGAGLSLGSQTISYGREILLCLAGPAVNFITAFFLQAIKLSEANAFCNTLLLSSMALGSLNLLPIRGFDGGRVFEALLSLFLPPRIAEGVITALSFLCVFALWSLSLYLLLRTSNSLSLFIFSLALFSKLFLLPYREDKIEINRRKTAEIKGIKRF